jgi:hypothetical protein
MNMTILKYPNCAKGCNDGGTYPCDCAMPAPSAPACFKCDDLGYTPGNEVFNVARCDCAIGVTLDMRAAPDYTLSPSKLSAGVITGMLRDPGPPEIVFGNGVLRISTSGMTYNGELIKDAGRAHRAFIATMEGRKPDEPLLQRAYDLINEARDDGQVLTIELVPLDPLAMGHYEMVADLRPKRERAPSPSIIDMIRENIAVPEGKAIVTSAGSEPIVFDLWTGPQDDATRAMVGKALDEQDKAHVPLIAPPQSGTEIEARCNAMPLKTMMHPDRRTEARKAIWPDPSKMNFTTERRDPHSTLTQEQFDKRSSDKKRRER